MKIVRYERIRAKEDEGRVPLWLMGLTDLVTLLLAFFILLFATSIPSSDAWNKASDSVKERFSTETHATSDVTGELGHVDAEKTWKSEERDPGLNLDYLFSVVKKYIESDPSFKDIVLRAERDMVILSLGEHLAFDAGQVQVSSDGRVLLRKLSDYLATLPNTLEVVGYADRLPLRSDAEFNSNWHLSLERAYQVAQVLKQRGYEADIAVRGKGVAETDFSLFNPDMSVNDEAEKNSADFARRVDLRLYLLQP